jgi:hypothetical protein
MRNELVLALAALDEDGLARVAAEMDAGRGLVAFAAEHARGIHEGDLRGCALPACGDVDVRVVAAQLSTWVRAVDSHITK